MVIVAPFLPAGWSGAERVVNAWNVGDWANNYGEQSSFLSWTDKEEALFAGCQTDDLAGGDDFLYLLACNAVFADMLKVPFVPGEPIN